MPRKRCVNVKQCRQWAVPGKSYCVVCQRTKNAYYSDPTYQANRSAVLMAAHGECQCNGCGMCHGDCQRTPTTADHIIPRSRGGTHDIGNLLAVCVQCNSSKRSGAR